MRRYGQVIKLKDEFVDKYKCLHANPWEEVNKKIKECNIRNYSIYYRDGYLFSYYEYVGNNYEYDMKKMSEDESTKRWWKECSPCQVPIETVEENEWWANMEEVYHLE